MILILHSNHKIFFYPQKLDVQTYKGKQYPRVGIL
jgi:hypothetical protein